MVVVLALAAQTARVVENAWDYTVLVNATVQTSPPQITLRWSQDTVAVPDYWGENLIAGAPTARPANYRWADCRRRASG